MKTGKKKQMKTTQKGKQSHDRKYTEGYKINKFHGS